MTRLFRAVEDLDPVAYFDGTYHVDVTINEAPALPYGGVYVGLDGAKTHARAFMETWGPHRARGDEVMNAVVDAVPDHAYVRWTLRLAGREFPFLSHYRFREGLIIEATMFPFDAAGLAHWWDELEAAVRRARPAPG